jgi:parallel beta-helix repeat protein
MLYDCIVEKCHEEAVMRTVEPRPGLVLTESAAFKPGVYEFPDGQGITIDADDITVEGNGAVLKAAARPAPLPEDGDFSYTPGDLGLCREEHELLMRRIEVAEGALSFQYRFWGLADDPGEISYSTDESTWLPAARLPDEAVRNGWLSSRWEIGVRRPGRFQLRLRFPASAVAPSTPCLYDGFRLLRDGAVEWSGDARDGWQRWYATGFSIYKRETHGSFAGVAVRSWGRSGVRLRNLKARGFLTGVSLRECSRWLIEGCDLSENYDDPEYGWGEGAEAHAALHLDRVADSVVRDNRARRVWNGVVLRSCSGCRVVDNSFTHCSNACLKMARSSRNLVADNDFSWGIRIAPGEVHARDSVSLLMESGSDDNRILRNDFSHGGDGIFIRVLNNWCCTGNLFEGNECSHANNNAIEAWSPGNTWVRNKANRSSYGFWLGGSDDTALIGNEARGNGVERGNAPEPFGNAGVAVVHGSSTGFLAAGNRVTGNAGPGLSVAFKEGAPARGWLVVDNDISANRSHAGGGPGHGVLLEHAAGIALLGNRIRGNDGRQAAIGASVRDVVMDARRCRAASGVAVACAAPPLAGAAARLSVTGPGRFTRHLWSFGDGAAAETREPFVDHVFARPGTFRVCVTRVGAGAAGIGTTLVCALPRGSRIAGCADARDWSLEADGAVEAVLKADPGDSVLGSGSLLVTAERAGACALSRRFPAPIDLSRCSAVSFFYKYACELFVHTGKHGRSMGMRLRSGDQGFFQYMPEIPPFFDRSEDRYAWVCFRAPREEWTAVGSPDATRITGLEVLFGPEEPAALQVRLDAVTAEEG